MIDLVLNQKSRHLGSFEVGRLLPTGKRRMVGEVRADGRTITPTQMAVFGSHADAVVQATTASVLMLLGGSPVGERFIEWNFRFVVTRPHRSSEGGLACWTDEAAGPGQYRVRSVAG